MSDGFSPTVVDMKAAAEAGSSTLEALAGLFDPASPERLNNMQKALKAEDEDRELPVPVALPVPLSAPGTPAEQHARLRALAETLAKSGQLGEHRSMDPAMCFDVAHVLGMVALEFDARTARVAQGTLTLEQYAAEDTLGAIALARSSGDLPKLADAKETAFRDLLTTQAELAHEIVPSHETRLFCARVEHIVEARLAKPGFFARLLVALRLVFGGPTP